MNPVSSSHSSGLCHWLIYFRTNALAFGFCRPWFMLLVYIGFRFPDYGSRDAERRGVQCLLNEKLNGTQLKGQRAQSS